MKYEVTLKTLGGIDSVVVDAATGDEAAAKATGGKGGVYVIGVHPAAVEDKPKRARLQGEDA